MRKRILLVSAFALLSQFAWAGTLPIVPTTTLTAETSNNTSAADSFQAQSNGNAGAGNVSKVDIHTLLYPGNNTKVIAHFMPWWGDPRHIDVGYSSHDPAQIHKQIMDMISRGVNGVIIDWYGSQDYTDVTAKLVMAEAEQHPGFTFAIMVDKGAISLSACSGCTPEQTLINQVQYIEQTYIPSPAYMRINGRPVITNFDIDLHYTIDWNAVQAATSTNPDFIFQHAAGFTHVLSGGSYAWVEPNSTDYGMSYLNKFYTAGLAAPTEYTISGAYKGFNDTLASWSLDRIMGQQCGQTWLQTFAKINSLYNSGLQVPAVQLVTWNDYEEGTEIETGIDNCFAITPSLSGSSLQWAITGNENTIDHYVVYISTDGQNLMALNTMAPGSRALDLSTYALAPGNYVAYVQAVGKPTIINQMSAPVAYSVAGSQSGTIQMTASPTALSAALGQSATATLTVAPMGSVQSPMTLSCSGLPIGMSCSFSPAALTLGPSALSSVMTISTGATAAVLSRGERQQGKNPKYGFWLSAFGVMAISIGGNRSNLGKLTRRGLRTAGLFGVIFLLVSCGGGTAPSSNAVSNVSSGTFTVTIHGDAGAQHGSATVMLTVH
jgi:Glycosyl hydrolase family 71